MFGFLSPVRMRLRESLLVVMFKTQDSSPVCCPTPATKNNSRRSCSPLPPPTISRRLALSLRSSTPPFLRCSAVNGAMRVERGHTAYQKRSHRHHPRKPHRFELSGHDWHSTSVKSCVNVCNLWMNLCVLCGFRSILRFDVEFSLFPS